MMAATIGKFELAFRRQAVAWCKRDGWHWLFIFKTILAALLAMGIAMRFDLDQPRTAMVTVFIVMQPQTGMVLTKSLYRIGGTLAGTAASLVLVSAFAQERELFILGLALWVGGCTVGAVFFRRFKSYGFVLSGYTAAMIGVPAALQPQAFFGLAVGRLTEIILGVLCAGVVSDVVFPHRLSDVIIDNVRTRYVDFLAFVSASLAGTVGERELERRQLGLVGHVIALESIRSAGVLEDPEIRLRDLRLRKLNGEFMAASTTFHSFRQLLRRLTANPTPAGGALTTLYESLGEALSMAGDAPVDAFEARRAAREIAGFRAVLRRRVETARLALSGNDDPEHAMDFDTAVELLQRFLRELHAYSGTYARLPEKASASKSPDDIRFVSSTDPVVALLTGARAFFAILLVGAFWIASAWPYGANALVFAATVSSLFAMAPDPPLAVRRMTAGFICGFFAALFFKFFVMASLDGFVLLCAGLVPVLMIGLYLCANPRWADAGTGFVIFFITMLAPGNPLQLHPVAFVNEGGATIMGILAAGTMFETLIPATGNWLKRRLLRQMRHQVTMVCFDPLEGLVHRFESGTHDLLHKLASTRRQRRGEPNPQLLSSVYLVVEVGRAIIHLRQDSDSVPMSRALAARVQESIKSTAALFVTPSAANRSAAIACVARAVSQLSREEESRSYSRRTRYCLRRMQTSLHLIRTALLDDETTLVAAAAGLSAPTSEGIPYAA